MTETPEPKALDAAAAIRAVLMELQRDPAAPAHLSRRCGIEEATILDLLKVLERYGALCSSKQGGEPSTYSLAVSQPVVLGVDLGGTKIHAALADLSGTIVAEEVVPTDARGGFHVVNQIGAIAETISRRSGHARMPPLAAAIGSPGVVDRRTGHIDLSANIPDFDKLNIVEQLKKRLGCSILVENDVNLGALGEQWHGVCRNQANFAYIALGTGIGMGLVSDGKLVRGARGAAGEIAFLPIGSDPFAPTSYPLGPLESAIGSVGIVRSYHERGGSSVSTVKEIFAKLVEGEPAALATLDDTARLLAQALMAVSAIADPELVVLGGGIGSRAELLERLKVHLEALPIPIQVQSSAIGTRAVVLGALSLAHDHACRAMQRAPKERSLP
jgi:predicted NBD/HSP70 family sugar kinase